MVAGVLLFSTFALLQTIPDNGWGDDTVPYLSEMNWASFKANTRQRELVEDLVVDPYQGTRAPIGQSVAPTPSVAPFSPVSSTNSPSIQVAPQSSTLPTVSSAPSGPPSVYPSDSPSAVPSQNPSGKPSLSPQPSSSPIPSWAPTGSSQPTTTPYPTIFDPDRTEWPSADPTDIASEVPSPYPSAPPSDQPSTMPSLQSDLYAEHFLTIVLDGIVEDFRPARWEVETDDFFKEFWDDSDANIFSPVFVGHVDTRYIKQTRIGEVAPGADNTSLPLAIDYQQLINYTMVVNDYDQKRWGDLKNTLFTYPFKLNAVEYMSMLVAITENPSTIFLSSYAITTPVAEVIGSSGTDAAIISILVIVVALVLLAAAYYVVHLLRKDRDAHEELLKVDQGDVPEVVDAGDSPVSQEVVESPAGTRYQDSVTPLSVAQPGHRRIDKSDSGSDRDENTNEPHIRHRSNSIQDDRSNYMSDLEGMVIDSHSVGDDIEEDTAGPIFTNIVDNGYPDDLYGSRDEDDDSEDDYEHSFHLRQTGFIMKVEDIDDEA